MDDAIPGAYPVTPQAELEPPAHAPVPAAEPRQHTKLHKHGDSRGHRHADSGIGLGESEPIQPQASVSPQEPTNSVAGHDTGSGKQTTADKPVREKTAGDWGNLPKSQRGGIYNTVTGHGSAGDDHDQHHRLPQRSTSKRAHVEGDTSEYPKGGVYNTVAGHGSRDEESKRHTSSQPSYLVGAQPGPENGELSRIAEEHEKEEPSEVGGAEPGRSGVADGSLRDAATRDDVALAASIGADQKQPSGPSSTDAGATGTGKTDTPSHSPRAFPPSNAQRESHPAPSESDSSRERDAAIATAAAAGAGIVSSEQREKPRKLKKREGRAAKSRQHKNDDALEGSTCGSVSRRRRREESESEKRSGDEGSSGEKKHRILGIFHRRKESRDDKDYRLHEAAEVKRESNDHHHPQEVAAGAAVGAGTDGLNHDNRRKVKDSRSMSEPSYERPSRDRSMRKSITETSTATAMPGSAFRFPREGEDKYGPHYQHHSPTNGSAPVPPARSTKRQSLTPPKSSASTRKTPAIQHSPSDCAKYTGAGVVAGLGASVFANIDQSPRSSEVGTYSNLTSPDAGITPSTFENPREPPPTPAVVKKSSRADSSKAISPRTSEVATNEPGEYSTLPSGTASGVNTSAKNSCGEAAMGGFQDYNMLDSGTASGLKHSISPGQPTESAAYNVLLSGTPSGVKIGPTGSQSGMTAGRGDSLSKDGDGQYNRLASGTASGIDVHHTAGHGRTIAIPFRKEEPVRPSEGHKPDLATYPSPETAKEMSPEVLPDSYREQSHEPHEGHTSRQTSSDASPNPPLTREVEPERTTPDPAPAAAVSGWSSNTGPTSSTSNHGKFTKENIAKMNKKHGSTGNWWQSAWTSV